MGVWTDGSAGDDLQRFRIHYGECVVSFGKRQQGPTRCRLSNNFNRGGEESGYSGTDEKQLGDSGSHDFYSVDFGVRGRVQPAHHSVPGFTLR